MNEKIEKKELGYYGFILSLISFRIFYSHITYFAVVNYFKYIFKLGNIDFNDITEVSSGISIFYNISTLLTAILGLIFTIISLGKIKNYTDYNKKLTIAGIIISSVVMLISILFLFIKL